MDALSLHRQAARRSGFTILELLVVLTVLGVLAAASVPTYKLLRGNAQQRALTETAAAVARAANAAATSAGRGDVTDLGIELAVSESGVGLLSGSVSVDENPDDLFTWDAPTNRLVLQTSSSCLYVTLGVDADGDGAADAGASGSGDADDEVVVSAAADCSALSGANGAPGSLTVTEQGGALLVSWPEVPGAGSYELSRSPGLTGSTALVTSRQGTSAQISGLVTGATYTFAVRALVDGVRTPWSAQVSGSLAEIAPRPSARQGQVVTFTWTVNGLSAVPTIEVPAADQVAFTNVALSGSTLTATATLACAAPVGEKTATLTTAQGIRAPLRYTVTTNLFPADLFRCRSTSSLPAGGSYTLTIPAGSTLSLDAGETGGQYGETNSIWIAYTNPTAQFQDLTTNPGGRSTTRWFRSAVAEPTSYSQLSMFLQPLGNSWQPVTGIVYPGDTVYIQFFNPSPQVAVTVAATDMQCAECVFNHDNFASAFSINAAVGSPVTLQSRIGLKFTSESGEPAGSAYGATTSGWLKYTNSGASTLMLTETVAGDRSGNGRTTYWQSGSGFGGLKEISRLWANSNPVSHLVYPGDTIFLQRYDTWRFTYSAAVHDAASCPTCITSDNLADAFPVTLANGASTSLRVPNGYRPLTLETGESQCIYGSSNPYYNQTTWIAYTNPTAAAQTLTTTMTGSNEANSWCHRRWYTSSGPKTFAALTLLKQVWAATGAQSVTVQAGQTVYLQHFGPYTVTLAAAAA